MSGLGESTVQKRPTYTKRVDLGEESMKSVLRQDGEVKWLEENAILSENEGVAASLRFRLSR